MPRITKVAKAQEPEEQDCETCEGTGHHEYDDAEEGECQDCNGTGQVTPDEPSALDLAVARAQELADQWFNNEGITGKEITELMELFRAAR